jgi:hypothetical protein
LLAVPFDLGEFGHWTHYASDVGGKGGTRCP